jgi:hypothetical protein
MTVAGVKSQTLFQGAVTPPHPRRADSQSEFPIARFGVWDFESHAGAATEIQEASSPLDWTINGVLPRSRQAEVVWEPLIIMML